MLKTYTSEQVREIVLNYAKGDSEAGDLIDKLTRQLMKEQGLSYGDAIHKLRSESKQVFVSKQYQKANDSLIHPLTESDLTPESRKCAGIDGPTSARSDASNNRSRLQRSVRFALRMEPRLAKIYGGYNVAPLSRKVVYEKAKALAKSYAR